MKWFPGRNFLMFLGRALDCVDLDNSHSLPAERSQYTKMNQFKKFQGEELSSCVPELQFVSMNQPGDGTSTASLRTIRRHAMKHVRRKKREAKPTQTQRRFVNTSVSQVRLRSSMSHENVTPSPGDARQQVYWQPTWGRLSDGEKELLSYISSVYMPLFGGISEKFVLWTKGVSL